jgi:hypothetical protein
VLQGQRLSVHFIGQQGRGDGLFKRDAANEFNCGLSQWFIQTFKAHVPGAIPQTGNGKHVF